MLKDKQFVVIGMEHYNPLGVIRSLGEYGIKPDYIAIKHKLPIASTSKYVGVVHPVSTIDEAVSVLKSKYGKDESNKTIVFTTDDDIESLLDQNFSKLKDRFVFFNSNSDGRTTAYMDKKRILELAEKHGLNVLKTEVVDKGVLPSCVDYPIITKSISPNIGGWKSDVHICENEQQLLEAFPSIQSPRVLIQHYVNKDNEICIDGFSINRGCSLFIPMYTTYNYNIKGYYSPFMTVHSFDLEEIGEKLTSMMSEIAFDGIFEAEFLVDSDGSVYFSEINFRNSTWSYAATKLGMPLPVLWAQAMEQGSINEDWYKPIPLGYLAMVEPIDLQKRVVEGETKLAEWLADFRETDCLYYYNKDDLAPFYQMVSNWEAFN